MQRGTWAVAIAAAMITTATGPGGAVDRAPSMPTEVAAVIAAAERGDCGTAMPLIARALKATPTLPDRARLAVLTVGAGCAVDMNDLDVAYGYALDASRFDEAPDLVWRLRFGLELQQHRAEAAVTSVEAMTQGHGAALNAIPIQWMIEFEHRLDVDEQTSLRRRLLAVLTRPSYQPPRVLPPTDRLRLHYAELLYGAGETQAALDLVRQIDDPAMLMTISVDPRFRAVLPADWSVRRASEAHLARLKTITVLHPDSLEAVIELASTQRALGRGEEALATLTAADPLGAKAGDFADRDEQLNWWWNALAYTHAALGHYDAAIAAFRQGMGVAEGPQLNVSQLLNLASVQVHFRHPQDALATLASVDWKQRPVSGYGAMVLGWVRGCAAQQAGNADVAATDLAYVRAHQKEGTAALGELLLCTGDLDGAAAVFIARLKAPDDRPEALIELSDYDPPIAARADDPVYSRIAALKVRPDVQAAIREAGGTRRFDVRRED